MVEKKIFCFKQSLPAPKAPSANAVLQVSAERARGLVSDDSLSGYLLSGGLVDKDRHCGVADSGVVQE